jgi:hypothetical protein
MQSFKSCVDKRSDDHAPHVFEFKRIFLMCRYNQSKVIDAKIASFDRQAHRQSSHTFQSHKESLKLMQMKSTPSYPSVMKSRTNFFLIICLLLT